MRNKSVFGFTLIELITVITIIGVLAVVVGPRFASKGVYDERVFYEDVLQALRFAHTKATGSGCLTQMLFSGSGYTISIDSDCNSSNGMSATDVFNPADFTLGYSQQNSSPSGMAYTSSVNPILFNPQGHALNSSMVTLSSPANIVIGGRAILVDGKTGYVR